MKNLTLADLKLGIANLTIQRKPVLMTLKCAAIYGPLLEKHLGEIGKLPAALVGGMPLAQELDETDGVHDGMGSGIWLITEAHLGVPGCTADTRAAAERIRKDLIPSLSELNRTYADEAANAKARRAALEARKADLEHFPVVGGTLFTWATAYIDAGEKLDTLLDSRSGQTAPSVTSRKGAGALRSAAIGTLNRFRAAVRDERETNPALPATLDEQLFSYLDLLSDNRTRHGPKAAPIEPPPATLPA